MTTENWNEKEQMRNALEWVLGYFMNLKTVWMINCEN